MIVGAQASQRRREESGPDETRHRQRHLHDEQTTPEPAERPAAAAPATEALVNGNRDRQPRGDDADGEANHERRQRRHGEHAGIRRYVGKPTTQRKEARHEGLPHGSHDRPRQRHRPGQRHGGQEDAVQEQLPAHARRASTQRQANSDLVPPRQRARQCEAGKVGRRDRQQQGHQALEHQERGAVPAGHSPVGRLERCHLRPLTQQRLPIAFRQRGRQRRRLNPRPARS